MPDVTITLTQDQMDDLNEVADEHGEPAETVAHDFVVAGGSVEIERIRKQKPQNAYAAGVATARDRAIRAAAFTAGFDRGMTQAGFTRLASLGVYRSIS
jgi:hypothetical protein